MYDEKYQTRQIPIHSLVRSSVYFFERSSLNLLLTWELHILYRILRHLCTHDDHLHIASCTEHLSPGSLCTQGSETESNNFKHLVFVHAIYVYTVQKKHTKTKT